MHNDDKTFTFTLQIDAPESTNEAKLQKAIARALNYATENDIKGAEALDNETGQITVTRVEDEEPTELPCGCPIREFGVPHDEACFMTGFAEYSDYCEKVNASDGEPMSEADWNKCKAA